MGCRICTTHWVVLLLPSTITTAHLNPFGPNWFWSGGGAFLILKTSMAKRPPQVLPSLPAHGVLHSLAASLPNLLYFFFLFPQKHSIPYSTPGQGGEGLKRRRGRQDGMNTFPRQSRYDRSCSCTGVCYSMRRLRCAQTCPRASAVTSHM